MMERLTAYDRPFFGRADNLLLGPLNPAEVGGALSLQAADAIDAYLLSGGLPGILRAWPEGLPALEFAERECADPASALFGVPEAALLAEFAAPDVTRRVIEAVGGGNRAHANIAAEAGSRAGAIPDLRHLDRSFALPSRLRSEGTGNLLAAALAAAVPRLIAQSYTGWPNTRTGGPVKTEDDPLDPPPPAMRQALAAIRHLQSAVTSAPDIDGVVLRYGSFYGPRTSIGPDSVQVIALVRQRRLPIVGRGGGIWSFTHIDDPAPVMQWLPRLAAALGAKPPRRIPVWLGRPLIGELGVAMMPTVRGSANARARRELEWVPHHRSWRTGSGA